MIFDIYSIEDPKEDSSVEDMFLDHSLEVVYEGSATTEDIAWQIVFLVLKPKFKNKIFDVYERRINE